MIVIRAPMASGDPHSRHSMSVVLDDGEIHHFYALSDGVHHSSTRRFRGRYDAAVNRELARPHAEVVCDGLQGQVVRLRESQAHAGDRTALAG
jgi:hypothetical protein